MNEKILKAYKGEIYGIILFEYFQDNYMDAAHIDLWTTLKDVERLTAKKLERLLGESAYLDDREFQEIKQEAIADAQQFINLPWRELVDTLVTWIEPYEEKYRAWTRDTTEARDAFRLIADHETALLECLRNEQQGLSGILYLRDFIDAYS